MRALAVWNTTAVYLIITAICWKWELEEGGKTGVWNKKIRDGKKGGTEAKEIKEMKMSRGGKDWLCRFRWCLGVKFCQILLNIHSPLFYDNEQTVEFDFNLKWRRRAVGGRGGEKKEIRQWERAKEEKIVKKGGGGGVSHWGIWDWLGP